jgi:hypothetical protein
MLRIAIITLLLTCNSLAFSQALNFNTPTIVSGTSGQPGCVYRFSSVTSGGHVDALVSIDSLIGGITLSDIDATPSGSSSTALQPQVSSLGSTGYHYAVFTVTFVTAGTTYPTPVSNFSGVFMGIDGSPQITEFNSITIPNAAWQYVSSAPKVAVSQSGNTFWGTATSSSAANGQTINEHDSTEMFKVSTPFTTSFSLRLGFNQSNNGWNGNNPFAVNFTGTEMQNATLPVNLLNFTAQLVNDKVSLSWSSKQEDNLSHYIIERSYNNETYSQVALIFPEEAGSQANSYSFKDAVNNTQVIYYRLKLVSKDGTYKISEVRIIRLEKAGDNAKISIYPNPVISNVNISIPQSWQNKAVTCQLLNVNGHVIKSFTIQQAGQTASIAMAEVPMGMYFVKAISGKETSTQPIVKSANR